MNRTGTNHQRRRPTSTCSRRKRDGRGEQNEILVPAFAAEAQTLEIATQQHIAQYAKTKGITVQQATKEFQQSGYKIQ